jgi:hypothetical protein
MKSLKIIGSKLILLLAICATIMSSCKKENITSDNDQYVNGWTRVIGVKTSTSDTSTTTFMHARTETVGLLLVEDPQLKAVLISYTPLPNGKGQYIVEMTNKQPCQVILRWMWEGLVIDNITPTDDVLTGNQVTVYTLIGDAKPGRIKVKAEKSNSDCSNSSTLILEISTTILPIEFTNARTERIGKDMKVTFSTDAPQDVDWFFVMWSPDGVKAHETIKAYTASDYKTRDYKLSFPAIKKEDLK